MEYCLFNIHFDILVWTDLLSDDAGTDISRKGDDPFHDIILIRDVSSAHIPTVLTQKNCYAEKKILNP